MAQGRITTVLVQASHSSSLPTPSNGLIFVPDTTMASVSEAASPGDVLMQLAAGVLQGLLAQRGAMLSIKAADGRIAYVNDAMARFLGRDPAQILGQQDADLLGGELAASWRVADATARSHPGPLSSVHEFEWQGRRHVFEACRIVLPGAGGAGDWLATVWTDVQAERSRQAQWRHALAQVEQLQAANEDLRGRLADLGPIDRASGLQRRAQFDEQLRREVDLSTREHREFSLVFIDIDPPTDGGTRSAGAHERIHEAIGRLLRSNTRAMDASCRYGQDRFAVLLSGVGLATAHARMEGVRRQCATQLVLLDGNSVGFTVSMGVASFPHTAESGDALIDATESALAQARSRGGNIVSLASIRLQDAPPIG